MKEENIRLSGMNFEITPLEEEMIQGVTKKLWDKLRPKEFDNGYLVSMQLIILDMAGDKTNFNPTQKDWLDLINENKKSLID